MNLHHVLYLIVGGLAVNRYGVSRNTGDMDVWIKNTEDNAGKTMKVIKDFGFGSLDLIKDDFLNGDQIVQLGFPPVRIDIMQSLIGVDFDEAYSGKSTLAIGNVNVNFIAIKDLIINKEAAGRKKDLSDAEALKKILNRKK